MSAAAARRRKQLAARQASGGGEQDAVSKQLQDILNTKDSIDEATAYEALQLAQSQVRRLVKTGQYDKACDLAYESSLALLKQKRVSVASQLLTLLVQVLRETHTEESDEWLDRIQTLQTAHTQAMQELFGDSNNDQTMVECIRLNRLQCDWLRQCCLWSSDLGKIKFGANVIHELLGQQCWKSATLLLTEEGEDAAVAAAVNVAAAAVAADDDEEEDDEIMELRCDAVQHMMLAEQPVTIASWLETLPPPTDAERAAGHTCPPAVRDALFTRALLVACALENLRDANILWRAVVEKCKDLDVKALAASYTNKEDGKAPSHTIFGSMLLRICEKDARTGPLYSWLLRSFKRELDKLYKPQAVLGYTTKIGKIYFNIQPPPSMLNMMENMMNMMGGGGAGAGAAGGMNPAMMQAALAQMQGGM